MPPRIQTHPPSSIPAGWFLAEHLHEDSGGRIKCYTNVLGQKFFTLEDLKRYITYAKKAEVSIYSEDFKALTQGRIEIGGARSGEPDPVMEQASLVGPASPARPTKPTERIDGRQRYRSLAEIYQQTSPIAVSLPAKHAKPHPALKKHSRKRRRVRWE